MYMETILPGMKEVFQDYDPVIEKLIEIRANSLTMGDIEATMEDLKWYRQLRDSGESIPDEDRVHWQELDLEYRHMSDEQITSLVSQLEKSENGDFINQ
jgi:hypothetical protein